MIAWLGSKKKLLLIFSVVLVLIVAGLLAVPLLIDETRVRKLIVSQLESSLHRKVSVQEAEVTVFTGIGVRLKNVLVSEDPRFGSTSFLHLESLLVQPSLLPLFRGKLELSSLQVVKPVIRLIRNAAGIWNISSLGADAKVPSKAPTAATASSNFAISKLSVHDGVVSVSDQLSQAKAKETQYEHIDLALTGISPNTPTGFSVEVQMPGSEKRTLRARGQVGPISSGLSAGTSFNADIEFSQVSLADLKLLLLPREGQDLPWEGRLTTRTKVQGDLTGALRIDGVTKFAGLRSSHSGQDGAEVNGDVQHKLVYQVSSGALQFESVSLQLPNSRVDLSGTVKPQGENSLLDLKVESQKSAVDDLLKFASVFGEGLPKGVEAKGQGAFHLKVAGSTAKPEMNGQSSFTDFRIWYPGIKEEIVVSPLTITCSSPTLSSNEVLISVGERTRLNAQLAGNLGTEKSLSLNVRTQKPVPVADLHAIGSSFGVAPPQGYSLQNGTIHLQLAMKIPLADSSSLSLNGKAFLSESQLRVPSLKVPLEIAKANVAFTGNSLTMSDLLATLNGAKLSGNLQWANFAAPSLAFGLYVDQMDVNALISILNTSPQNVGTKKASLSEMSLPWPRNLYAAANPRGTPISDPMARLVISDSRISIRKVKYDTFTFTDVSTKVRMRNKLLDLDDLELKMNHGIHTGRASLDFSGAQPRYTLNSKLKNVDSNEFLSQNTSLKNLLYGPLSLDLDVSTSGSEFNEFLKQMKGKGNLSLVNGKITSFDLMEKIAMFGKLAGVNVEQGGTTITSLTAPFQIGGGLVSTDNLQMRTPSATVRAAGSFALDSKNVDYRILAELPYQASKGNDLASQLMNLSSATFFKTEKGNIGVPLRMTGNISKPAFALDAQVVQQNLKSSFMKGGPTSLESLQNLFKPKKAGESSSKPSQTDKTDQTPSSPVDDLLKELMDKTKKKK
jgi:uncharacterized protein involved in outer membrane biogenesis